MPLAFKSMHGIISWGTYLPYRRLDRAEIAATVGQGGGRGTRTVASFDEDPITMAVEASRHGLRSTTAVPDVVMFGSVLPAYADKTNANTLHAALRLPETTATIDVGMSARSVVGAIDLALDSHRTTLVAAADIRTGLAGSAEEAAGGDAAAMVLVGQHTEEAPVVAERLASHAVSAEFVDRWRSPGETRSKVWDEKFAEITYVPLGLEAVNGAMASAGLTIDQVSSWAISAPTARIAASMAGKLEGAKVVDNFAATVGQTGAAQPSLLLTHLIEQASPGDVVVLLSLSDGANALVFKITDAARSTAAPTVEAQAAGGAPVPYGKFLSWRGTLAVEPPRRPEPQRVSATAAARSDDWKFGFVASQDSSTGAVHLPPMRVSADGERTDEMHAKPMADLYGTIATFTVDRVAYSPSPPIVFAVVDFDGGGRLPIELCDCDEDEVAIGARVAMTFRRLHAMDGIVNYFWKARLDRG